MRLAALLLVLCSACFPGRVHDCETPGGLLGQGVDCEELWPVQQRFEAEAAGLGFGPNLLRGWLVVQRHDLNARGGFDVGDTSLDGLTYCDFGLTIIARINVVPHEAFHVAQGCPPPDENVRASCLAVGHPHVKPEDIPHLCDVAAWHPHWGDAIEPAIQRINNPE